MGIFLNQNFYIMKKYISIIIIGFYFANVQAQEAPDAMRYAQDNLNGTARFRAMGGAFGALGGDLSSINVNPAGSAIFNNNVAAITLSSVNLNNKSDYFGTKTEENDNTLDLNQAGAAWVFKNTDGKSDWEKFTVAVNYENMSNFNNTQFSAGHNPNNSVADYFIYYADGIPLNIVNNDFRNLNYSEQQTYLGYNGYLINPVTGSTNQYESNANGSGNYYQENSLVSSGYNGKLSVNASASYKDKIFFGININAHFTDYTRRTSFYEDYYDSPGYNATNGLQSSRFDNDLYTYGSGISFQAGIIAKVIYGLRAGLSYESPTWYFLHDELTQSVYGYNNENGTATLFYATPEDYTMIYPSYRLKTPGRYTGSLAYVFGKTALLSFDYTVKDYSNTRFKPQTDFTEANAQIDGTFDKTSEFRIGGEYKIKQWSLRGGYRFEQSPYKNNQTIGNLNSYSGGVGYGFGRTKIDLAYTYAKRDYNQSFFNNGFIDGSNLKSRNDNVSVTVLFEL
jgi:hypothetical protein